MSRSSTSKDTFAEIREQKLSNTQWAFACMVRYGKPCTAEKVRELLIAAGHKTGNTHDVSARLTDLNKSGLIWKHGETRSKNTGRPVQLWKVTTPSQRNSLRRNGLIGTDTAATSPKMTKVLVWLQCSKKGKRILEMIRSDAPDVVNSYIDALTTEAAFQTARSIFIGNDAGLATPRLALAKQYATTHENGHKPLPKDVYSWCASFQKKFNSGL